MFSVQRQICRYRYAFLRRCRCLPDADTPARCRFSATPPVFIDSFSSAHRSPAIAFIRLPASVPAAPAAICSGSGAVVRQQAAKYAASRGKRKVAVRSTRQRQEVQRWCAMCAVISFAESAIASCRGREDAAAAMMPDVDARRARVRPGAPLATIRAIVYTPMRAAVNMPRRLSLDFTCRFFTPPSAAHATALALPARRRAPRSAAQAMTCAAGATTQRLPCARRHLRRATRSANSAFDCRDRAPCHPSHSRDAAPQRSG